MADRIPTVAGVHGGALVIAGFIYTAIGTTWLVAHTETREEGISWLPWESINSTAVGWLWVTAGLLAFFAGLFSKNHRRWENAAYFGAIFVPSLLAAWFLIAWYAGAAPTGILTSIAYGGYGLLLGWIGARVRDEPEVPTP